MGHFNSKQATRSRLSSLNTEITTSERKYLLSDDFAGIALIKIIGAEMMVEDKWLTCVSHGERAYRTEISDRTKSPIWNSEKKLLLEHNGPQIARVSVFETNRLSKSNLVGYCEINLFEFLSSTISQCETLKLLDPSSEKVVGTISLSCNVEDPIETEKHFTKRILSIVDFDKDGKLSLSEFSELVKAFGNQAAFDKKEELFKGADKNEDGQVNIDELAELITSHQEKETLISSCLVCGESLKDSDMLNTVVHLSLCFDEGTGNQMMTGGFMTDEQATLGWAFKLSEWVHFASYDAGLNSGASASHILVLDRRTKRLVEEIIDGRIILSMRALYQSKIGLSLMDAGVKELLRSISEKQGEEMNSTESAKKIPKFVKSFKDQINLSEAKFPIEHFKTFNEFFTRELKPGARTISHKENDNVAVCAADCRLMAFKSLEESQRFWIKGRKFSIQGLLGEDVNSDHFASGTLVIFRLAPQDYHRFHFPVSGRIEKCVEVPGCLYTVNPIAVNSKYCNVFTENKRVVSILATEKFGKVAFVSIGATMVGSISLLKNEGDSFEKGEEYGYFSFGGSTVICVFEKDGIVIDDDLVLNSQRSLETLVAVGMSLGVSNISTS